MRFGVWKGTLLAKELLRPYLLRWLYFPLFPAERPEFFDDCWRYPNLPLTSQGWPDPSAVLPEPGCEPDLLFLPMTDWHARTQRTQQLAHALAEAGHRCFYVNPHLGRQFPVVYVREPSHRVSALAPGIAEVHVRLPREPVIHQRLPTVRERRRLVEALETVARRGRVRRLVQIVSLPFWLEAARELKRSLRCPILYDCHDLLTGFQDVMPEVADREPDLFRLCDLAVFSSRPLLEAKLAQFPWLEGKSLLIRNAVTPGSLCENGDDAPRIPRARARKVVGYIGALDHWFDVAAVREAAMRKPEWEFVLIGRIECRSLRPLRRIPNVKFLGEVPHAELTRHLSEFDVAWIPFVRNELTLAADPIKVYEYFSFGLPVVSTRLPEVERFGDLVYLAGNAAEFTEQLERAAGEQDPSLRRRRQETARQESWVSRTLQFQQALKRLLSHPQPPA